MFHTKAVNVWKDTEEASRMELVKFYMEQIGGFKAIYTKLMNPDRSVIDDPLYLVCSYKV